MAKPRFTWEVYDETYSLIFKVTSGDRETTWRIGPRPNTKKLAELLLEIVQELDALPQDAPVPALTAAQKPLQDPETPEDTQMTEEGSAELRAAKARAVEKTGKAWFSNMEQDEELPLYTLGHEE